MWAACGGPGARPARRPLDQLDASAGRRTFVDLIPLFGAAELSHGLGPHAVAGTPPTLPGSPAAARMSLMDVVDLARRAFAGPSWSLDDLESAVRGSPPRSTA